MTLTDTRHAIMQLAEQYPYGTKLYNGYDEFVGSVVGWYVTREGKPGLDLQQEGTRVVHVYGTRRLEKAG